MYVHPEWSRRGVGTQLLQAAEQSLLKEGVTSMVLTAALSALDFYLHQGYRVEARRRYKSRGGLETEVCRMLKRIEQVPTE